ncbi:hypothetical protein like AT1G58120 [Hibiscus trionum]|uniref:DUF7870 domain-containing protein n=1 Tax=Hibiscus trionum TaxID=183268 RepID=A0A9W7M4M5_HIBTR|nr:hypothetical protein like AT1G58120 [Hibiscus trionum]
METKSHNNKRKAWRNDIILHSAKLLMVKALRSRVFKFLARFLMVLALTIVLFPWLGVKFIGNDESGLNPILVSDDAVAAADPEFLPFLFNDLSNEGILKQGNKGLLLNDEYDEETIQGSLLLTKIDMKFSAVNDFDKLSFVPEESFDFIFSKSFQSASELIDRSLKIGGTVAVQELDELSSHSFNKPSNYKIVYYRKFRSTNVFVMKKLKHARPRPTSDTKRRLLWYKYNTSEAKKAALKKLEDVLLEPPRASSGTSKTYRKRTKYLPDLLGDTLESYPRRVFIDVGLLEKDSGTSWFAKHYPTRNLKFDIYKIETLTEESTKKKAVPEIGMSDWLRKNVKEEEYVVMKAEAEVVEDMMKSKAIRLVDELFMECNPKGAGGRKSMSRRAYWECLALYGKLRDEGVAVHQWWG